MKITVYLAGDVSSTDRWRPQVLERFKGNDSVVFLSPIDGCRYSYKPAKEICSKSEVFLYADYHKIDLSDIILVFLRACESRHSGTSAEVGYARAKRKLIIYVNAIPKMEWHFYEFIQRTADIVFDNLGEGLDFLEKYAEEMNYLPMEDKEDAGADV